MSREQQQTRPTPPSVKKVNFARKLQDKQQEQQQQQQAETQLPTALSERVRGGPGRTGSGRTVRAPKQWQIASVAYRPKWLSDLDKPDPRKWYKNDWKM